MVAKAIALYDAEGPARAFATMNAPDGGYRDGELYLFVLDPNNQTVVHAGDPSRVGNDANQVRDADGQPIGPLLREAATPEGAWAAYRFMNFDSGQVEPKSSWVVLKDGYLFGSGVYGPQS